MNKLVLMSIKISRCQRTLSAGCGLPSECAPRAAVYLHACLGHRRRYWKVILGEYIHSNTLVPRDRTWRGEMP